MIDFKYQSQLKTWWLSAEIHKGSIPYMLSTLCFEHVSSLLPIDPFYSNGSISHYAWIIDWRLFILPFDRHSLQPTQTHTRRGTEHSEIVCVVRHYDEAVLSISFAFRAVRKASRNKISYELVLLEMKTFSWPKPCLWRKPFQTSVSIDLEFSNLK